MKIKLPGAFIIVIGTLLWLLSYFVYDQVWYACMIIIGVILLIRGILILKLASTLSDLKLQMTSIKVIKSIILIISGICLIIPWTNYIVIMFICIFVGVVLLALLITNFISSNNKKARLKKDGYLYVIALLIIALGIKDIGQILAVIISSLIICYGIYQFIRNCIDYCHYNNKSHNKNSNDEIIGTDYYVEDNQK